MIQHQLYLPTHTERLTNRQHLHLCVCVSYVGPQNENIHITQLETVFSIFNFWCVVHNPKNSTSRNSQQCIF